VLLFYQIADRSTSFFNPDLAGRARVAVAALFGAVCSRRRRVRSCSAESVMNSTKTASQRHDPQAGGRNLVSISPFFIVKDLQASIAHYIERFGFQLDFQGPEGDVYYGQVSRDGIGIFLKTILPDVLPRPNHTRHAWARWDAYVYTLDPDALFEEFRQRGASFVKELSFIDDGLWGFEVRDADGYVLAFFRLRKD
jgi:hypothetical protein